MACTSISGGGFKSLKQGDTTTISMELSESIGGNKLKLGIYSINGDRPLFETTYPDDGLIELIDETNMAATLPYDVTRNFVGMTTLRLVVFSPDMSFVNAGENCIRINWASEPATKNM